MRPATGRLDRRPSTGKSVRFTGSREDSMGEQEQLDLIKKLENPHTDHLSSDEDHDFPVGSKELSYPTTDPPPYSPEEEEEEKDERVNSPEPKPPEKLEKRGSLHELVINKVTQPFANMMKAMSDTDEDTEEELDRTEFNRDELWVLELVENHRSESIMVKPQLQPFNVDFIPAIGDIDAFIKIPRPDEVEDNAGLTQLDEPAAKQSDPTILDMQMRSAAKEITTQEDAPVKKLQRADKHKEEVDSWIANIKDLHRTRAAPSVNFKGPMPDVEKLMQEWPQDFEKSLGTVKLPTADLDCSLEEMVDLCCNLVDIPVGASRVHSLYQFFSLYSQFKNSQHFKNLDHNRAQNPTQETTERLEL